jgi:outer membrane lipoprotein SlyB
MKRFAGGIGIAAVLALLVLSAGCTKDAAVADADAPGGSKMKASNPAPVEETLVMPAGTRFLAVLDTKLSTDSNKDGDAFAATTTEAVVVDGRTVAPAGTRIDGVLRDVQASGRIKDRARMTLVFQEMTDAQGKTHSMNALPLTIKAASETHNDAIKIAGGSAAGAVLGALSGKKNGTVIGAAAGAGAGTILVLATKGDDVELDQGLKLYVEMTGPMSFVVARK